MGIRSISSQGRKGSRACAVCRQAGPKEEGWGMEPDRGTAGRTEMQSRGKVTETRQRTRFLSCNKGQEVNECCKFPNTGPNSQPGKFTSCNNLIGCSCSLLHPHRRQHTFPKIPPIHDCQAADLRPAQPTRFTCCSSLSFY